MDNIRSILVAKNIFCFFIKIQFILYIKYEVYLNLCFQYIFYHLKILCFSFQFFCHNVLFSDCYCIKFNFSGELLFSNVCLNKS